MQTPDDIRSEMIANAHELRKAPDMFKRLSTALNDAQDAANLAEAVYKDALDDAFLESDGSVAERQATARKLCRVLRDQWNAAESRVRLVRAELDRVELKRKQLDRDQMQLQSQLKSIQLEGA